MKTQSFNPGDRVAYSARFLRSIADYSHASASMRGTVQSSKRIPGMKSDFVKIAWDGDSDELRAGALAANLTLVSRLAANSVS